MEMVEGETLADRPDESAPSLDDLEVIVNWPGLLKK
jgi:hypothetical protein